jgi:hypothetical protein
VKGGNAIGVGAIVEVQQVGALQRVFPEGGAHVEVLPAVPVDVDHGHAGAPVAVPPYVRLVGHVLKFQVALVEVQLVGHHVAGKVNVGPAVVVEVADADAPTVVNVFFRQDVKRVAFGDGVRKVNPGLVGGKQGKQGFLPVAGPRKQGKHQKRNGSKRLAEAHGVVVVVFLNIKITRFPGSLQSRGERSGGRPGNEARVLPPHLPEYPGSWP